MSEGLKTPEQLLGDLGLNRVLAFAAHPDDIDFGASGTIAAITALGVEVHLCLLTVGDAGGFDLSRSPEETARLRRQEQEEAAAVVGISSVEVLDERDGFVEPSYELVGKIVRQMRSHRPDAVLSFHPERAWDRLQKSHPDHLACGEAVVRACYPAVENPFAYPELEEAGLSAFKVKHLLLMGSPAQHVNLRVDITGHQDKKLAALGRHFSQHRDAERMREFVTEQMQRIHGAGGYAEDFHHVVVNAPETISGF
ncbi:PIG-L family deacetylase [Nesterenkonia sp. MY13]|uniref:PIG-L family deacetylase n=1 Tax=Nesterenkonia sedimenti TaxID=1463632 RepID=A0A7X8TLA4_9MICC|nr:PIG-L deacetylase family protein [Nesterenkonia sedimenti]NLS10866.1 PIG-L family deacetylase [Nesterenkonia sedimenti]